MKNLKIFKIDSLKIINDFNKTFKLFFDKDIFLIFINIFILYITSKKIEQILNKLGEEIIERIVNE